MPIVEVEISVLTQQPCVSEGVIVLCAEVRVRRVSKSMAVGVVHNRCYAVAQMLLKFELNGVVIRESVRAQPPDGCIEPGKGPAGRVRSRRVRGGSGLIQ